MPDAVKLYDHDGNPIDGSNPLPISTIGGGGGATEVEVTAITLPTAVYNGVQAVAAAGTAEALGSTQALTSGVTVKAFADNTGDIYVGSSTVDSTNGFVLAAGEQVFIEIDDLAKVFVDAETNDEGVSWIAS